MDGLAIGAKGDPKSSVKMLFHLTGGAFCELRFF
jgi:hypothetical protein